MTKHLTILCVTVTLIAGAVMLGCSGRENPSMSVDPLTTVPFSAPMRFSSIEYNAIGDPASRVISIAWASELPPSQLQAPFPVLYLLHDFDGDGNYFGQYNLQGIMEEMFRNGEIGRMLVVTVGAENSFGGSYYRNSVSTGRYADLIGESMNFIENVQFSGRVYTGQFGKGARGISGHGMGGYGAVRYAMENPDDFASVSSMSAPLSFTADWNGHGWFEHWIDSVFLENGVVDSATYRALAPNDPTKPFTNRLFAMSAAFSPRELDPFDSVGTCFKCANIFCTSLRAVNPCSLFGEVAPAAYTFEFPPDPNGYRGERAEPEFPANVGVDLPVLWTKALIDSVWQFWLASDATEFLKANPGVFSGMKIYLDCGTEDQFGYLHHNRDFRSALNAAGYQQNTDYIYVEYERSPGIPAGHGDLIGERLRHVLKFHSDQFAAALGL